MESALGIFTGDPEGERREENGKRSHGSRTLKPPWDQMSVSLCVCMSQFI